MRMAVIGSSYSFSVRLTRIFLLEHEQRSCRRFRHTTRVTVHTRSLHWYSSTTLSAGPLRPAGCHKNHQLGRHGDFAVAGFGHGLCAARPRPRLEQVIEAQNRCRPAAYTGQAVVKMMSNEASPACRANQKPEPSGISTFREQQEPAFAQQQPYALRRSRFAG
jgi:hypothetical protein